MQVCAPQAHKTSACRSAKTRLKHMTLVTGCIVECNAIQCIIHARKSNKKCHNDGSNQVAQRATTCTQARCASTHHGQSVHCICVHNNNSNAANTSASTTLPQASHTYFGLHTMAPTHLICTAQYTRKYSTPQHSGSEKMTQ